MSLPDLSKLDAAILDCLKEAKGRPRHCAWNSVRHLERAWALADIDAQMALFRAITAEEEAATAVFIAVKQLGYPNADRLNHRRHDQKQGLFPFLMAVNNFLASFEGGLPPVRLAVVTVDGSRRLILRIQVLDGRMGEPQPPLNFSVTDLGAQRRVRFTAQLAGLASTTGSQEISDHLRNAANLRNELLYAGDDGIPGIKGDIRPELAARQQRVLVLLRAFCLIFPYQTHALFVQQALDAFLVAVGCLREEELDW